MVNIVFDKNSSTKFTVIREFKDHIEQLLILSIFLVILLISLVIQSIIDNSFPKDMLFYVLVLLFIIIYYIFPTCSISFDLENNRWDYKKLIIKIPYKQNFGLISNVSKINSYEVIDHSSKKKKKFSIKKTEYFSALQLWLSQKDTKDFDELMIFSRKTYSYSSHNREVEENIRILNGLKSYFEKLEIPIIFDIVNQIKD